MLRLALISVLLFLIVHLPKGGPADIYAADPAATPAAIERMKQIWGLDQPLHVQYLRWIGNLTTGDWGQSYVERRPARDVVMGRLGNTLRLTAAAMIVGLVLGVGLGIVAGISRSRVVQGVAQFLAVIGMSIPTFWSGALVLLFFSARLRWIPAGGMGTIGQELNLLDGLWHLAAPALVLGSVYVAQWARYVQASLSSIADEDFIRTARAKGLPRTRALLRHGLSNVMLPLITVLGLEVPRLVSGAMVTEVVFSWPGIGRLLNDSLLTRDYPVVLGALLISSLVVIVANLLTDISYSLLDPRVRYG
ncbi:MAG: ABC transporter permease [Trueperaceae bacterium]|nr:ABC transporter permease [Trueperaceae bacterium]